MKRIGPTLSIYLTQRILSAQNPSSLSLPPLLPPDSIPFRMTNSDISSCLRIVQDAYSFDKQSLFHFFRKLENTNKERNKWFSCPVNRAEYRPYFEQGVANLPRRWEDIFFCAVNSSLIQSTALRAIFKTHDSVKKEKEIKKKRYDLLDKPIKIEGTERACSRKPHARVMDNSLQTGYNSTQH